MSFRTSTYDRFPYVAVSGNEQDCLRTWQEIRSILNEAPGVTAVELYPGCNARDIASNLACIIAPDLLIDSSEALLSAEEIDRKFETVLSDDPVFGYMSSAAQIEDFFCKQKLAVLRDKVAASRGRTLVIGTGASLIAPVADRLVYADLARWEIQRRQRAHLTGNLGLNNAGASPAALYKRAFFLDWRAADRLKTRLFEKIDLLLDTNVESEPKLITGSHFRAALKIAAGRPFRVVPFFDPGPWGGQWMKEKFQLPEGPPNYAWCFDCVPEENSLLLGFGSRRVEVPAIDLVLYQPEELLGSHIVKTFGAEFPIRFDYLDTMMGGNLSLQVHPLRQYIRDKFGMDYTQDESYYMLDAGDDGIVYLGLREGIDSRQMEADLRLAQEDANAPFPAEKYVNIWRAQKHDHFLIPAGTIHCSGRNGVVLEISATPYIFTFKLWDWGRLGLDGKPRPIHLDHGLANIQWDRTTEWVKANLINRISTVASTDFWREESTGLHELEFIETRRHWFMGTVPHDTAGTVNVLNLVEGDEAIVESPTGAFAPFTIHYGETFIVPAQVGAYTVRPAYKSSRPLATMKAFVREDAL